MSRQNKTDYLTRVEKALAEGKLWKAKEILQGNVATREFDLTLYERYGLVLLEMEDLLEAGKYLFLSGQSKPEYGEAINLYLSRHARNGWQNLYATFPSRAKLLDLQDYPDVVSHELRRLGYPEEERRKLKADSVVSRPKTIKDRFSDALAIAFVVSIILCFVVGVIVVIKTLISWIF